MKTNEELLTWYVKDYMPLTEDEYNTLISERPTYKEISESLIQYWNYEEMENEFFNRMPFCNITPQTNIISFANAGKDFIKMIFEKHVDDDTLVITTHYEHDSVKKELEKCKNVYKFNMKEMRALNIQPVLNKAKQFKKAFIYVVGTNITTGEITPQDFFIELVAGLKRQQTPFKIMCDDVHGMFLTPRDYSIFDYVLYTAHSLVSAYECGILIQKRVGFEPEFGELIINWGYEYLKRLDMILMRKEKLFMFKHIMIERFRKLLTNSRLSIYNDTSQHIFSIKTQDIYISKETWEEMNNYFIRFGEYQTRENQVRMRCQEFIKQTPEEIIEACNKFETLMTTLLEEADENMDRPEYFMEDFDI